MINARPTMTRRRQTIAAYHVLLCAQCAQENPELAPSPVHIRKSNAAPMYCHACASRIEPEEPAAPRKENDE